MNSGREPVIFHRSQPSPLTQVYRTLAFRKEWADAQLAALTEAVDNKWSSRIILAIARSLVSANHDLPKKHRLRTTQSQRPGHGVQGDPATALVFSS